MPRTLSAAFSAAILLAAVHVALAGGGPHNVLVVANDRSDDSVAVANAYLAARGIPERNLCRLSIPIADFGQQLLLKAEAFEAQVVAPLKAFLAAHPAADRLHYIVLCPDLPLRVDFGKPVGTRSLAAVLTRLGAPVQGSPRNPYVVRIGAFEQLDAGDDAVGRMRLVTVLRGYERRDALDLIRRSLDADGTAPKGAFHFVPSQHTRGYEQAAEWLTSASLAAEVHERGKPLRDTRDVMAYFSGGSYSGLGLADVASNTYRPGAVVDMLESYGAVWVNWRGLGLTRQLPVPWFIRAGATGVHGTTDEPYAGAFPSSGYSQAFFANYAAGGNLAEAYWSAIPALQWQNAVFGDPLCAPYAVRPTVTIPQADATAVHATIKHGPANSPKEARLFVDGRLVARTGGFVTRELGTAHCSFDLASAGLVSGTHRVRVVVVDGSPHAVQGWAVTDLVIGDADAAPQIALTKPKLAPAAGDTLQVTCSRRSASGAAKVELRAGATTLGTFTADALDIDTARLGPGAHELQALALDDSGKPVARSNILKLDLAEPLHVVDLLPGGATGTQPIFYLRYNAAIPSPDVISHMVHLRQGSRDVHIRTTVDGARLTIEPTQPLLAEIQCTLTVTLPQDWKRSRDMVHTFTPSADARLLYPIPADICDASTVDGRTTWGGAALFTDMLRPSVAVLGPVDIYSLDRPARWSLPACTVSAKLSITDAARPQGQDTAGAGLGVMYSDINNRCFARIEREAVVVYQVLKGQQTVLARWPAPGKTTGVLRMDLRAVGPQLTVSLDGRTLGTVEADRTLPPGLPWIDLGAGRGVMVREATVNRIGP